MPKRPIQKSQAVKDPTIIWNTFIDVISDDPKNLDPEQRPAHFVLVYEAEVQNGGHLQYFYNHRNAHLQTLSALTRLGATCQPGILKAPPHSLKATRESVLRPQRNIQQSQ